MPDDNDPSAPDGMPIEVTTPPTLTTMHSRRLRSLWGYGRPVMVGDLGGVDLDLLVHGFVKVGSDSTTTSLTVTRQGIAHINEVRQARIAMQSGHHALGHRLCDYLREKGMFTWENVEFCNPAPGEGRSWGVVRPDVFACMPVLRARNAAPTIYEVKVNRADFLADLARPEKRGAYADLAEAVYYCCPAPLISRTEVPQGFGLIYEMPSGGFQIQKNARRKKDFTIAPDTIMTLMVKRQMPLGDLE
ncbi:hypothetical protein RQP54_18160 [Curvibacter sp. APW13]|uniref:hypothetical protein n=1 Tax=Curvibacter sp. APW13 TaxID=3077236 RepID=UPI0028E04FC3|nr:hypothetical protein [Curvibacter sp. APW13]MDT8992803.1 hypothetical protein [Curvibacter sp. APW13]